MLSSQRATVLGLQATGFCSNGHVLFYSCLFKYPPDHRAIFDSRRVQCTVQRGRMIVSEYRIQSRPQQHHLGRFRLWGIALVSFDYVGM